MKRWCLWLSLLIAFCAAAAFAGSELPEFKTQYPLYESALKNWAIPFDSETEVEVLTGSSYHTDRSGFCIDFMPIPRDRSDIKVYAPFSGYVLQTSNSIFNSPEDKDGEKRAYTQRPVHSLMVILFTSLIRPAAIA